ncbi:hypothetical protein [Pseudomonas saliphila]|uniref:hypothetical protein n=1 Tax=Pseudomonas saliphila TaxID=2586906 RepID=UPI001238553F|nr:hypothetical protein [Pseudomonas saliphila]
MFKLSDPRYPEQFWCELIAYQIGLLLNVPVPPAHAAYDSLTGECGSLSEWFYEPGVDMFYAAGYFFYRDIRNFDKEKGAQHNLQTAMQLNKEFIGDNQIFDFWSMMLFDCVIGNTDRHQENWGYLVNLSPNSKSVARRKKENFSIRLQFAPWFDNGTSLGYQLLPHKFNNWTDHRLDGFITKGTHHIRFALDRLEQIGHVESMRFIAEHNPKVRQLLIKRLKDFEFGQLERVLDRLVELPMPIDARLTRDRADFVLRLTSRRLQLIMENLNERN